MSVTMPAHWFDEAITEMGAAFSGKLSIGDLPAIVGKAMEIPERIRGMSGPDKKAVCIALLNRLIDETRFPWWIPDVIADPICKALVPGLIDALCSASKGEFVINQTKPEVPHAA